ncbi:hypothetical protein [Cellulomonas carbonis]|uniref:Uncharacterized protein n=1 Tax=Cellulomonas carbonis T26 TaxID=947969 RepID=A0A0A0BPM4_9CELL|nr:hypothetical protein [Cellulomonas carbonis]KGM09612.1 hypothetical protein N868_01305 [Cellulomonas carbonis T26]
MTPRTPRPAGRRRPAGQARLLGAAAMLVVGALLPWLMTAAGPVAGMRGPGVWTLYAGVLALAGGLVPHRRVAAVHGAVVGAVGVGLPLWQVVHVLGLVGTAGWAPGPGLVMTAGGGVLALAAAAALWRTPAVTA